MQTSSAATDLLPARMVNEFVYCPRLFYYEFVEGIFIHNADTLEGKAQHKRQDSGKGAMPQTTAEGEPEVIHSRSVSLFSDLLGVTAKLDVVETHTNASEGGAVAIPVEYKKGAPREGEDGKELWDTDRIQLGLQILLLRENGYSCDEGIVYYRETRQRVRYEMTEEEADWIRTTLSAVRRCTKGPMPPPLDHSVKCPRCSLVSICLPDETRLLKPEPDLSELSDTQLAFPFQELLDTGSNGKNGNPDAKGLSFPYGLIPEIRIPKLKAGEDVRRLIAPNPETRALYLNTAGHFVGKKDECLVVKEKGKSIGEFRLKDLHHVALFGPVQISTAVVHILCERDIPISYFSMGGWFYGMTRGHSLKNVFTRIEQFNTAGDPEKSLPLARLMVHGKIRNQRTLLMRNHVELGKGVARALKYFSSRALSATSTGSLLGLEGNAAALYYAHFAGMIKSDEDRGDDDTDQLKLNFDFDGRNRRPPRDPVNALLSLTYSLLVKDCTLAAYSVGLDPYIGFYHQPRFGKPAMALDLMEEFRPLIADSVVLTLINQKRIRTRDFITAGKSVGLTPSGRKAVFHAYEQRMSDGITHPVFGYKVSYRRALELQVRLLAKTLTGDIEQYVPFMTR
ncbi:MAG: CRISPR-associated endonuclease Cas1 [Opitutales bacterium]|nr:CRISPR-associated endonuclease Cas1 [Opitutales bacterium]